MLTAIVVSLAADSALSVTPVGRCPQPGAAPIVRTATSVPVRRWRGYAKRLPLHCHSKLRPAPIGGWLCRLLLRGTGMWPLRPLRPRAPA
jgi:hypothetical protein